MNQKTVTNGFAHTHEDRPFQPPHESPLGQATRKQFGCTPQQLNARTGRTEAAAIECLDKLLLLIDERIRRVTGETDEEIVKYGFAKALVWMGAFGAYNCVTNGRDTSKSASFADEISLCVMDTAVTASRCDL